MADNVKENKHIFVERETYEKNGKTFFSYVIKGKIRGKDVKANIVPYDFGGYSVLDVVFGESMIADIVVKPYEFVDDATGRTISGNTYAVQSTDENGEVFECAVKPARRSDKALLDMLIR